MFINKSPRSDLKLKCNCVVSQYSQLFQSEINKVSTSCHDNAIYETLDKENVRQRTIRDLIFNRA